MYGSIYFLVIMIIYGYIARISIGKLFMGGVLPGFICAACYIGYVLLRCYLRPEMAPKLAGTVRTKSSFTTIRWEYPP